MGFGFWSTVKVLLLIHATGASVAGTVRDGETGEPLPGVEVCLADLDRTVLTGVDGRYFFPDVPAGPQHMTVRRIGYAARTFHALVPAEGTLGVNVGLTAVPLTLRTIEVRAAVPVPGVEEGQSPTTPDRGMSLEAVRNHPLLSEPDVLQALDGGEVTLRPESPGGLHIRGGASDQVAYLLDGIPVFSPYHVAGTFSAWNPDALARVDLLTSSPPPAFPDALSGAISARTRSPGSQVQTQGSFSTTQVRMTVDGPLGRRGAGYLLSVRNNFPGLLIARRDPSYLHGEGGDQLGKVESPFFRGRIRLLAYASGTEISAAAAPEAAGAPRVNPASNAFTWNSRSFGAEWTRKLERATVQLRTWSAIGEAASFWRGQDSVSEHLATSAQDQGLVASVELVDSGSSTTAGIRAQRNGTDYRLLPVTGPGRSLVLTDRTPIMAAFVRHARSLTARTEAELAMVTTVAVGRVHFSPRVQIRWNPSDALFLSGSYARLHQFSQSLRNPESVMGNVFPVDLYLGAGQAGVPVARSDQGIIAFEYRPTGGLRLGVQAYARDFKGLALVAPRDADPFASSGFVVGSGHAHGVSVNAGVNGSHYGIVGSYGLQEVRLVYGDTTYVPHYGATHSIDLGMIVFPSVTTAIRLGASARIGRRTTAVEGPFEWESCNLLDQGCQLAGSPGRRSEPLGSTALPGYLRVDLGVRKHWHLHFAGRDGTLALFGTATNILGRKNRLTVVRDPATGQRAWIDMRPRSPLVVGIDWQF